MPTTRWFADCARAMGGELQEAGIKADRTRAVVQRGPTLVAVEPDTSDEDRVVVCCELPTFVGVDGERLAALAVAFTSRRALVSGCVWGFNAGNGLSVVGRSCDRSEVEGREAAMVALVLADHAAALAELSAASHAGIEQFAAQIDRAGQTDGE